MFKLLYGGLHNMFKFKFLYGGLHNMPMFSLLYGGEQGSTRQAILT
jgi:hypothetical protein